MNYTMKTKEEILEECGVRIFGAQQARILEAMESYHKQKLDKPVVSGKRLAETLTEFLSEFRKYYNNGKEPIRLREEAFIEIWAHQFSAACASGAVDKTVSVCRCKDFDETYKILGEYHCSKCNKPLCAGSAGRF